jgi:tetratricopeptide (TPR) repeat protein
LGAYQTGIELLRALFPDGEDHPPRLKEEGTQAWTLNTLSTLYGPSGDPSRRASALKLALELAEREGDKKNLMVGLVNLAGGQMQVGELASADESLRAVVALCREISMASAEGPVHSELGFLLTYEGAFGDAAKELDTALALFADRRHVQGQAILGAYRALRALLMGRAEDALEAAGQAHAIAGGRQNEADRIRAEWLIGWALVALASEDKSQRSKRLAEAEDRLNEALRGCRRINLVYLEPDILLAWARWHRAKENVTGARKYAEEALAIADRCEYRLKQAEIHNFLSRLALDEGDSETAKEHAEKGRERAWCDGPPHCYKPALEEAERLLAEAG